MKENDVIYVSLWILSMIIGIINLVILNMQLAVVGIVIYILGVVSAFKGSSNKGF